MTSICVKLFSSTRDIHPLVLKINEAPEELSLRPSMPRENHQLEPGPLGTAEFCSKDAGSLLQLMDLRRTRDSIAHSMGETLAYDVPAPGRASCPPALAVIEAEVSRVEASIQGGLRKVWLGQQQACKTSGPSHGTYPLCGPGGGNVWVSAAMTSRAA